MTASAAGRRLAACLALTASLAFTGALEARQVGFAPIAVQVAPIGDFEIGRPGSRFGALEFRGGLVLHSRAPDFGAFSGLDFMPDGSLLAVADTGSWFSARPVEKDGRLVGLEEPRLAPMLGADGKPLAGKRWGDAESLRVVERDGQIEAIVGFEVRNDLRRFVAAPDISLARPKAVALPKTVSGLRRNAGLEALAVAPTESVFAGAFALVAERSLDANGNHRGWILGGPRRGTFSIVRTGDFDVTDAAFLPDGDLLILERLFNFPLGIGFRIRRIAADDLVPGATVDGRVLIEADLRYDIDNMEGMALRPGPSGETLITLTSDDNQSMLQRTLLLQFALPGEPPPLPRLRPVPGP